MSTPQVRPEEFVASLEQHIQEYLQSVMQAVNQAPDGEWIAGSEESVRDLSAKFRRQVFEKAIQARIDADGSLAIGSQLLIAPSL